MQNIFKYFKSRHISGYKIARDLKISKQLISHHVNKESDPTLELIDMLAKKYKIKPYMLFKKLYEEIPEPPPKIIIKKRKKSGNIYDASISIDAEY